MEFGKCLKANELIKLTLTVLFLLLNNESKTPKNKKKTPHVERSLSRVFEVGGECASWRKKITRTLSESSENITVLDVLR